MSFGSRLAALRKEKGLTQDALGKGLATGGEDAKKSVVYGWEKDQHFPRADQLAMICEKLGCTADYLLFGSVEAKSLPKDISELVALIDSIKDPQGRAEVLSLCKHAVGVFTNQRPVVISDIPPQDVISGAKVSNGARR